MTDIDYCCSILRYLVEDDRMRISGESNEPPIYELWTSRLPENGDWEPETVELKFCPNCGVKL